MNLLAKKRVRDKKRKEEVRKAVVEELFKKPQKSYVPSKRALTIITGVIFILVIVYIVIDSEVLFTDECSLMPGIDCENLELAPNMISFELHNFLKEDYNITLSIEGCEGEVNQYIRPNTKALFEFRCPGLEKKVKKDIYMNYVGFSGLPHDKIGKVQGTAG